VRERAERMPFTREEMLRILAAMDKYKCEFPKRGAENARRIRALVLLLRYSGMRIGDAVSLTSDRIEGTRLFLYTQKTGTPVNTVLPEFVLNALDIPRDNRRTFLLGAPSCRTRWVSEGRNCDSEVRRGWGCTESVCSNCSKPEKGAVPGIAPQGAPSPGRATTPTTTRTHPGRCAPCACV
jgi:hypothetical protein